jgi:hypothetical protein
MTNGYDRAAEDVGNVIALEHVNIQVPDQRLATIFYLTGMGFTRDPYLVTGVENMWINVGRSQFHLPTGEPQLLRGHVGIVVPDREQLLARLATVKRDLADTRFDYVEAEDYVDVTSPWGNLLRCHEPKPRFGRIALGIPYIDFDVPAGAARGIAAFYGEFLGAPTTLEDDGRVAHCAVGNHQELIFREREEPVGSYDGHHLQVYLANFSRPHAQLSSRGLVSEESDQFQYRFRDIVDPESGELLYQLEHEVRSMTHPLYGRPLVNRDPHQTNRNFAPGHEDLPVALAEGR